MNDRQKGRTILHMASRFGHANSVRQLVAEGFNVNDKDQVVPESRISFLIYPIHPPCMMLFLSRSRLSFLVI
jgi:ankyrin repeat protein